MSKDRCSAIVDGEQCARAVRAKGLCGPHRAHQLSNKPFGKLRRREYPPSYRDEKGRKWCANCLQWKPPAEFPRGKNRSDGLYTYCKSCSIAKTRYNNFRMEQQDYDALLAGQDGKCATCEQAGSLVIDHDHACCEESGRSCGLCIRGLLCSSCNSALGLVSDSEGTLNNMLDYLKKWRNTHEAARP